jgi:carbamoyltransferase
VRILGISCWYHDAAAALLVDGMLVAASQEERFTRRKNDPAFPRNAARFCLQTGGLAAGDLDYVVFYEKPLPKFERILRTTLSAFPQGWLPFRESMLAWVNDKLWAREAIARALGVPRERVLFVDHHLSHAASAFFCSPFADAAVLTVDGVGEWTTSAIGHATADWGGGANAITLTKEVRFPHSLGLAYSAFTAWLGFRVNSGEYKVMGMAPYGQPRYREQVDKVLRVHPDGGIELDLAYVDFHRSLDRSYSDAFVRLFGQPRAPEAPFFTASTGDDIRGHEREAEACQRYADVAASIQAATEDALLAMAREAHRLSGSPNLVMAGGVALNSVANGRIMREGPFEQVSIHPNAGDAGGALGAALYAHHVLLGRPRRFTLDHASWGHAISSAEAEAAAARAGLSWRASEELAARAADLLARGKVLGLADGRAEWGPRALGARSILADPRSAAMKETVNAKIKFRELFRPFAPVALDSAADRYFDLGRAAGQQPQRFMLMVTPVRDSAAAQIPAVSHQGTARVQTVPDDADTTYRRIIQAFGEATGTPVLLNTSFNRRGEPIVNTADDAVATFLATDIDALILADGIIEKP